MPKDILEELEFGPRKIRLWCRKAYSNDAGVCDEVCLGDYYDLEYYAPRLALLYPEGRELNVLDFGAHIGSFSAMVHDIFPEAKIRAYEMHPDNIPLLKRNIGSFADVYHACVHTQKNLVFADSYLSDVTGGSRAVDATRSAEINRGQYSVRELECPVVSFDEIVADLDDVALAKFDIEGAEIPLFQYSEQLHKVQCFVGEYHGREEFRVACREALDRHFVHVGVAEHGEGILGKFVAWRI